MQVSGAALDTRQCPLGVRLIRKLHHHLPGRSQWQRRMLQGTYVLAPLGVCGSENCRIAIRCLVACLLIAGCVLSMAHGDAVSTEVTLGPWRLAC